MCCSLWGRKESDTTEQQNWTDGLSSSHVQMWEQDNKEGRKPKNWRFQIVTLEKILESSLESKRPNLKEINPEYSLEVLM